MVRQYEYQPCIPTRGTKVPAGPDRFHEIKHDGYRLIVQREGKRVRLLTRRGYDWSDRYPLIVQAALRLRKTSFVIDGKRLSSARTGISDFDALHGGRRNADVRLYAFDLLADDGVDMRDQPLQIRKLWLGKLCLSVIGGQRPAASPISRCPEVTERRRQKGGRQYSRRQHAHILGLTYVRPNRLKKPLNRQPPLLAKVLLIRVTTLSHCRFSPTG
jgi:ATP-dependent DNA ligase